MLQHAALEEDVARRWWNLPPGVLLPLSDGAVYRLVFTGRRGGSLGPDVRDAVFHLYSRLGDKKAQHCSGDVEFHIRSADWFAHQHHEDARYNNVILHVVLLLDAQTPARRQDGTTVPTCSLYDLPHHASGLVGTWPCQNVMQQMSGVERERLLEQAGLLRFEQKTQAFVELLRASPPQAPFNVYDVCLIPALAEGLGYGRDRAFFRAAGCYLMGLATTMPEPLGRTVEPPSLDAQRLRVLRRLVTRWRSSGAWQVCSAALYTGQGSAAKTMEALRSIFDGLGVARADILICNVVLPFAAAVALLEGDMALLEQARRLYLGYPGLASNQVTRGMVRQLGLHEEPRAACLQQGLHYIYQQACREKLCGQCITGKRDI